MMKNKRALFVALGIALAACMPAFPQDDEDNQSQQGDFAAHRLLTRAEEFLKLREYERGVKMLETVIDQYPSSPVRFQAYLMLGKHFMEVQQYPAAIERFRYIIRMRDQEETLSSEQMEWYLEAQYMTGMAYFHMRDYNRAFTVLRSITSEFPNSIWANQAYYYIGLCHFALENWNRAIEALGMVGTFVDPDSPTAEYAEAGRRFYVKIEDEDIPILIRTGREISVDISTKSGDKENIKCVPVSESVPVVIGSVPTEPGVAKPGDGILQVVGGDYIKVHYVDMNTADGKGNTPRESDVRVVSTASIRFTLADFESPASAAYLGQPLHMAIHDLDRDVSPEADTVTVRIISRYKRDDYIEDYQAVDMLSLAAAEEDQYEIRDEINLVLNETGDAPVHTGVFTGSFPVHPELEGMPIDKFDEILSCALNDEIVAYYEDTLHINGEHPREITARIKVAGEIDTRPKASQNVVEDAIVKARKNIIEATAYLELTKIFQSMGLMQHAEEKSREGMARAQDVILEKARIPSDLKEQAFQLKWSLEIAVENYSAAANTCRMFSRLYPNSSLADEALMQIGIMHSEEKDYDKAIQIFKSILSLPNSHVAAEAQFLIAETLMAQIENSAASAAAKLRGQSHAMQAYQTCAERYPNSPFAGKSLGKLVDYYYESKDYTQAEALLERIFQDYPDADFLDSMLLKWVIVAFRSNNFAKAKEKCEKLLFDYPNSEFAAHANSMLPAIEKRLE